MSKKTYKTAVSTATEKSALYNVLFVLKTVVIAYAFSVILLVITALIAMFQSMSDRGIGIMVNVVTALGAMLCGFLTGRKAERGGLVAGAVCGIVYTFLLWLAGSLVSGSFSIGIKALTMQIIGVLCGAFGGIIGINTRKERRKK